MVTVAIDVLDDVWSLRIKPLDARFVGGEGLWRLEGQNTFSVVANAGRAIYDHDARQAMRVLRLPGAGLSVTSSTRTRLFANSTLCEAIVSQDWVRAATGAGTTTDPAEQYQYFWWVDLERPGRFYALGNFGQYIYVAPDADAIIVRTAKACLIEDGVPMVARETETVVTGGWTTTPG